MSGGVGGVGGGGRRPPGGDAPAGSGVPQPKGKGRRFAQGELSPLGQGSQTPPSGSEIELIGRDRPGSETTVFHLPRPRSPGLPPRPRLRIDVPPSPLLPLGGGSLSPSHFPERVRPQPETAVTRAETMLTNALRDAHFPQALHRPGQEDELEEQRDLQRQYIAAAAPHLAARRAMFGNDFQPGRSQPSLWWDGNSPTVLVEALKGAALAMVRTPVTNTIATRLDPVKGEFSTTVAAVGVAGALGGLAAYGADTLTLSIDRRAAAYNLAILKPVDTKVLVPDPSPVVLKMTPDGRGGQIKEFRRRSGADMAAAMREASLRRDRIAVQQTSLAGQGPVISFLQGGLSAGFNVLRRSLMSESALLNPIVVGAGSAAAGGAAGFITKGLNNVAKIVPRMSQVEVDNLVGGHSRINMFVSKPPHADRQRAGWNSVLPILGTGMVETKNLLWHTVAGPARSLDALVSQGADLTRYAVAATATAVGSAAVGLFVGQIYRDGNLDRMPGESLRSGASQLQQTGQSGINDAKWNGFKNLLITGLPFTTAKSYDLQGAQEEAELRDAIPFARRDARRSFEVLRDVLAEVPDPILRENLAIVRPVLDADPPRLQAVRTALALLETIRRGNPAGGSVEAAGAVINPLTTVRDALAKIEQIGKWRVAAPLREELPGGARA